MYLRVLAAKWFWHNFKQNSQKPFPQFEIKLSIQGYTDANTFKAQDKFKPVLFSSFCYLLSLNGDDDDEMTVMMIAQRMMMMMMNDGGE